MHQSFLSFWQYRGGIFSSSKLYFSKTKYFEAIHVLPIELSCFHKCHLFRNIFNRASSKTLEQFPVLRFSFVLIQKYFDILLLITSICWTLQCLHLNYQAKHQLFCILLNIYTINFCGFSKFYFSFSLYNNLVT